MANLHRRSRLNSHRTTGKGRRIVDFIKQIFTMTGDDQDLSERVGVIALLCAWACLFAVYLVFAGQASDDELVAGAICAGCAVLWWVATRRASARSFAFDFGAWAAAGRACRNLPRATLSVATVLLQALVHRQVGTVQRSFYAHGRTTDPAAGGRRAVGVLSASLAPDSFVLRTPVDRDEIVVHDLLGTAASTNPRWPI